MQPIARHKAAIHRQEVSRPIRAALEDGLISTDRNVLDYGCGFGDDVRLLQAQGVAATGWDPVYAPNVERRQSDVVNLGYVLNVIEDPAERVQTLRQAWGYAQRVLVVAARLSMEGPGGHDVLFSDGYLTRLGTFQKYFDQSELRALIRLALDEDPVAAGPGVFYIFRDSSLKESLLSRRQRRLVPLPRVRKSDELFEKHKDILMPLMEFAGTYGRLPHPDEFPTTIHVEECFGTVRRAFAVVRRVTETQWTAIREIRSQDLLVYLALARFRGRPNFTALPRPIQHDIRAFFSTYANACRKADEQLFAAGKQDVVDDACRGCKVGKQTPSALYIHASLLERLPTILRVFEGCARAYMGTKAGANVVKLHRDKPAVSYLYYPTFETEGHPALQNSLVVYLQGPTANFRDYSGSDNPPVLHRKEEFVADDHPLRQKFERLTKSEEARGLYADTATIGTRQGWEATLRARGLVVSGHRLMRSKG